ncbi:MAG: DNA alkylation repair protein [Acutalibacteraceae bacterium]
MALIQDIQKHLFELQDEEYRKFHSRLMPTVDPKTIIGVRVPLLRKYAKELNRTTDVESFLKNLPHTYYEENNLHAFLLESVKDYNTTIVSVHTFLPFVDNWATCDMLSPKVFGKHRKELLSEIDLWLSSSQTYTVRFGLGMLMRYYLDDLFSEDYLVRAAKIQSNEYYVNMMIAWYFATALAKQYTTTVPYLEQKRLSTWIHNKTIQKAVESCRIDEQTKKYLRTLKIK